MSAQDHKRPNQFSNKAANIDDRAGESFNALLKRHKINSEEYDRIKTILGRAPTYSELGVFSASWSEHCSYKSSRIHLKRFPSRGPQVVVPPGENAGVIRISGRLCAAFKMESHNHPSYLEPYQGAATGVGGILRDVFCMGARPIANLNCLRFGSWSHPRTPYLYDNVVRGIGDYGNCVGIPTVGGNLSFDSTYDGNCLVNAMTVGLINDNEIFSGQAAGLGNLVVYVGSSTGRDGVHGATMASDSFSSSQNEERGAIQVGDPFTEKMLLEATLEVLREKLVVGLQDMGAAGLTSSSFEMAARAGTGLFMNLDLVPVRTKNMSAYELMLSESQERMLMVMTPEQWPRARAVFEKWQLSFAIIGEVTNTGRVEATLGGVLEIDLPVAPVADEPPRYDRPQAARKIIHPAGPRSSDRIKQILERDGLERHLLRLICGKHFARDVFEQYDAHIGTRTVLSSIDGGAALLWLKEAAESGDNLHLGLGIATSCPERLCEIDPKSGSLMAVLRCARMLAAAGCEPLGVTDCLNFGNPERPEIMRGFSESVDGISEACIELSTPIVSGNVSLYNETDGKSIFPTPMIGMIGRCLDIRNARPANLYRYKDKQRLTIGLLEKRDTNPEEAPYSASQFFKELSLEKNLQERFLPDWRAEKSALQYLVHAGGLAAGVVAVRDVGEGGWLATLTKMCVGFSHGFSCLKDKTFDPVEALCDETSLRYIMLFSTNAAFLRAKEQLKSKHSDLRLLAIGETIPDAESVEIGSLKISVADLHAAYMQRALVK